MSARLVDFDVRVEFKPKALRSAINAFCRRCKDDDHFLNKVRACKESGCPLHCVRSGARKDELIAVRGKRVEELAIAVAGDWEKPLSDREWSHHDDALLVEWRSSRPSQTWAWIAHQLRRPLMSVKRRWAYLDGIDHPPNPLERLALR